MKLRGTQLGDDLEQPDQHADRRVDGERFAELYRDAYPALRLVATYQVGRERAEDVVQQAAVVALERLDRFEAGTDFRAWMAAIVRGVARNHRRGEQRLKRRHEVLAGMTETEPRTIDPISPPPDALRPVPGLRQDAIFAGFDASLRNALESLGPQQQACLVLKTVFEYSYREIACLLEMPEATARSHVHRARLRLLEVLGGEDGEGDKDA